LLKTIFASNMGITIGIIATAAQKQEWLQAGLPAGVECVFCEDTQALPASADAIFDWNFTVNEQRISALRQYLPKPVFINSVTHTLKNLDSRFIRINGWPGFIKNAVQETAAADDTAFAAAQQVLAALGKTAKRVPDVAGLISPRTIAMIVNEAYFALGEGVSTEAEIDIAMKLGTNYPLGPFEWSRQIGLANIYELLTVLAQTSGRYQPAEAMKKAVHSKTPAV
jgi:3-hydroxybutyryl-CoA dehydrogenase